VSVNITPSFSPKSVGVSTFVVDLHYIDYKYVYRQGVPFATNLNIDYNKQYRRISPSKNTISNVRSFVNQFSGCEESHKLRKRMIALGSIHKTISNDTFRFPIKNT
jgi:hypothetical protein